MAGSVLSGLTMNPNYHEFGPSLMENELAKIATGGRAGLAYSMGNQAHTQRLEDNENYYNRLDQGDRLRQGYAMQLGAQGQQTEFVKMLTAALAHENVPVGAAIRVAQRLAGGQPMATPELDQSDRASNALGAGNALKSAGEGIRGAREGGVAIPAESMDGFLKSIIGGGGTNVAPTTVEAAGVKATADAKPKMILQSGGYGQNGKDGVQISGEPGSMMTRLGSDPNVRKLLPDLATKFSAPGTPMVLGGAAAPGLNNPPPMAPGTSVGPLSSANAAETPGGPAAADTAVQPQHYSTYQQVLGTAQQQGSQLGSVQPMGDGSLLIPETRKGGASPSNNIRIYKDPSGSYKSRREPL